jgi:nucleoside-diphosphate-sugar epimerase
MERVLITGSLGYFGSKLSSYLTEKGYKCIGFDTGFFRDSLLYAQEETKTVFMDMRTLNEDDLNEVDVVIHLAGISNDPLSNLDPASVYDPTRDYSLKIARFCKKKGIRFIFASSCSVYGVGAEEYLTESTETSPQTGYSLNKLQIEQDLASISSQNFSPVALRFATIFGLSPRMRFDVVINMLVGMALSSGTIRLNSNGKAWRPNLHILDACESVRCAIELKYDGQELLVLNVGADENNLQVLEIAKIIQKSVLGSEIVFLNEENNLVSEGIFRDRKIKKGVDTRTYKVSFEKIKLFMPEFNCIWNVEEGVKNMIKNLNEINFDEKLFKKRGFYRLQHLEDLYDEGKISKDLFWDNGN